MVRSMIGFAGLPISFWGYALESTCYILNRVPSKSVAKTPYEIWMGRKPVLAHLRVWECPAYVKRLLTDKLGPRSDKYLFVRYPKEYKGYYFYHTREQKLFVSLRATFLKKKFLIGSTKANVELNEVQQEEVSLHSKIAIESALIGSNPKAVKEPLRRSSRVPCQPDRYFSFLVYDGDPIELDENDENLITYMDGLQRSDSKKWLEAMKSKMESMKINSVWTMVDPPEGIKPIGCK